MLTAHRFKKLYTAPCQIYRPKSNEFLFLGYITVEVLFLQEEYEFEKEYGFEYWETKLPRDADEIIKLFEIPPKVSNNKKELFFFLCNGIYFDTPTKVNSFTIYYLWWYRITYPRRSELVLKPVHV